MACCATVRDRPLLPLTDLSERPVSLRQNWLRLTACCIVVASALASGASAQQPLNFGFERVSTQGTCLCGEGGLCMAQEMPPATRPLRVPDGTAFEYVGPQRQAERSGAPLASSSHR